jgi:hypothetical protein
LLRKNTKSAFVDWTLRSCRDKANTKLDLDRRPVHHRCIEQVFKEGKQSTAVTTN